MLLAGSVSCSSVIADEAVGLLVAPRDATHDRVILNLTVISSQCRPYTNVPVDRFELSLMHLDSHDVLLASDDDLMEY